MQPTTKHRQSLSVWSAGLLLFAASTAIAASPEHQERHFAVKGHPVVVLQNIVNGRIEVKSSKNQEVVVASTSIVTSQGEPGGNTTRCQLTPSSTDQ